MDMMPWTRDGLWSLAAQAANATWITAVHYCETLLTRLLVRADPARARVSVRLALASSPGDKREAPSATCLPQGRAQDDMSPGEHPVQ